jgi:hypothetical protein
MMKIAIRQASHADFAYVASHLRESDWIELRAAGHADPVAIVSTGWTWGGWKKVAVVSGRPAALFGVSPSFEVGAGLPWMLATDDIRQIRREVIIQSREEVERMQRKYGMLKNLVHRGNDISMKWLEWLGFTIDRTPIGPGGQFFLFHRKRAGWQA